jgi:Laminin G domain
MVMRRIASAWIALAAAGASGTACNAILGNQAHELASVGTEDGSAAPDGPADPFDGQAEGKAAGALLDANVSPDAADEMDGLSGSSDGAFDSGAGDESAAGDGAFDSGTGDESAAGDGAFDSGAGDESAADAVDSQASPQDAPDEQSVDASDAAVDDATREASDGAPAPDATRDAATCSNDIGSLSNIGTQNFHISFRIVTTQVGWVALVNQRSGCGFGFFWDIRQCAPGRDGCPAADVLIVETDNNDQASYQAIFSKSPVNDGQAHDVVVARTARMLTIQIDGNAPSNATTSVASFGATMPPVQVGKDVCIRVDSTVALTGTLSNLCITSP